MLPKNHIGKPSSDHWSGLVDGVYAIALTLLALEIPQYLQALSTLKTKGFAYEGMSIYLFLVDTLTYGAVFFVLYEMWSFHRAVICIGKINSKGQTLTNALILAGTSFIPAGVAFYLNQQIEKMTMLTITDANIISRIGSIYGDRDLGNSGFLTLYCLIYLLLARLTRKSDYYLEQRELKMISLECKKRAVLFACLVTTYAISMILLPIPIPSLALMTFYVIYAYLDYGRKNDKISIQNISADRKNNSQEIA